MATKQLDKEKLAKHAVQLFKKDLPLTDIAEKITGKERGQGLNFTRALLVKSCAEAKAHFAASAKRYGKQTKKASQHPAARRYRANDHGGCMNWKVELDDTQVQCTRSDGAVVTVNRVIWDASYAGLTLAAQSKRLDMDAAINKAQP